MDKDQTNNTLVTIITVCFNAESCIERTMRSVLKQTYKNIEYIVKDGESKDCTNMLVERYREQFEKRGVRFLHVVNEDKGIYDAMNQATEMATGEYVIYMNADDVFFSNNVLKNIFEDKRYDEDILYGDSVCQYEFIKGKKEYTIWKGQHQDFSLTPFSHQACLIKTQLMKEYRYDTKYRCAGDFHLFCRFFVDGRTFRNVSCIIPICTMDGFSNTEIKVSYKEAVQVKKDLGMKDFLRRDTNFRIWFMGVKQWILVNLPYMLVGRLLRFQVKRKGNRVYKSIREINSIL